MCKTGRLFAEVAPDVKEAAAILARGGTVAFPTETVYGLGANALDPAAVAKIFAAKQRPAWDPLIVHVSNREMLDRVASIAAEHQPRVGRLIAAFWPGPLTLLLPRTSTVPDAVTAGRPLVGVRMPGHPVALELIRLASTPVAAPSANRFGHTSPTTAAHVLEDLDGRIDAVLDGGATTVGVESTVLDPTQTPMMIYRPGAITLEMIRESAGCDVIQFVAIEGHISPESLPSPGVGLRHYAPRARLILVEVTTPEDREALRHAVKRCRAEGETVGVMLPQGWSAPGADATFPFGEWDDMEMMARRLFAGLRALDATDINVIVCPIPAANGIGAALRDRLQKAARL